MLARLAILLTVFALFAPAAALAQQSPFQSLPPAAQETTTNAVTVDKINSTTANDDSGMSGLAKAAIVAFGAVLLAGIAWLIVRDARARAPIPEVERGPKGTVSPQRHARARAKAKAAKAQRKRNRARR
jgi:hypothetical protein